MLNIELGYAHLGEGIWRRTPGEGILIRDALHRVLKRLPNVCNITVRELPYAACKALIEALVEDGFLKEVYHLGIAEIPSGALADALPWHRVPETSRLTSLTVDNIDHFTTSADNSTAVTVLPSIRRLEVSLAFQQDGTYPYKLTIDLPNLKKLVLTDDWNLTIRGATLFLRDPGIPSTLESLEMSTERDSDWLDENPQVETVLPRFKHLRHLRLDKHNFTATGILPYLQSLPDLTSLAFGEGSEVHDGFLAQLLSGPTALRCLKSLKLDHVEASKEAGPEWPAGCTARGLARAIDLARARGVAVSGSAIPLVR